MSRKTTTVSLLLATLASPLAAQGGSRGVTLYMKDLRTGFCVQFLSSPTAAQAALASHGMAGPIPIPIESVAEKYPVLAHEAAADTTFHGWIPGEYCWYLYRSAVVGGRTVEVERGSQPVLLGYLALAARPLPDSAGAIVVTLFTNAAPLDRALASSRMVMDDIDFSSGFIPGNEESPTERRYSARHGRTTILWDGGPGGTRPAESRAVRVAGFSMDFRFHGIRAGFSPDSAFVASGNLGVAGGGEIQALMGASPIRFLTTYLRGGDADWVFDR